MSPIIVDKEKKRKEILAAARTTFRKYGYHNCSISDIAREAGIGKGTIYEYFKSKEDLFLAVFNDVFEVFGSFLMATIDAERRPVKKIRAFFNSVAEFYDNSMDEISLLFEFWGELSKPKERRIIDINIGVFYDKFVEHLARILDEGKQRGTIRNEIDSTATALMLMTLADGTAFQALYGPMKFSSREMLDRFAEVIFNGVLTPTGKEAEGEEQ